MRIESSLILLLLGSSAPIPVQRALERYYNKTHIFPDSYDVRKLVKKVNKEENLSLSESEVQKTGRNFFSILNTLFFHCRILFK